MMSLILSAIRFGLTRNKTSIPEKILSFFSAALLLLQKDPQSILLGALIGTMCLVYSVQDPRPTHELKNTFQSMREWQKKIFVFLSLTSDWRIKVWVKMWSWKWWSGLMGSSSTRKKKGRWIRAVAEVLSAKDLKGKKQLNPQWMIDFSFSIYKLGVFILYITLNISAMAHLVVDLASNLITYTRWELWSFCCFICQPHIYFAF